MRLRGFVQVALVSAHAEEIHPQRRSMPPSRSLHVRAPACPTAEAHRGGTQMTYAPTGDDAVRRKTRVVVVDDHRMVRAGIRLMLEAAEDLEVVAEASDGAEAVSVCAEVYPDIVLMDVSMPGMDGPEAARRITAHQPDVQVLMLTAYRTGAEVLRALEAGAVGYLMKDADPADLVQGIRAVARGESPLDPRAVRAMLQANTAGPAQELTDREWQVV